MGKFPQVNIDWETLLCAPGVPSHPIPDFSNSLSAKAISLADLIIRYSHEELAANLEQIRAVDISVGSDVFSCLQAFVKTCLYCRVGHQARKQFC